MGQNVANLYIKADSASAQDGIVLVGFHIDLVIPKSDVSAVRKHLAERHWTDVEEYLISLYPQHDATIETCFDACRKKAQPYLTRNIAPSAVTVHPV